MARTERFVNGKNASLIWWGDKKRKDLATEALRELKREGLIRGFVWAGDLSILNPLKKRVDFYIVYIDGKYRVCPLSVRDKQSVGVCRKRHPEIAFIDVAPYESKESIKSKILREIELRKTLSH